MRIVLDTNIYIAAALNDGLSNDILDTIAKSQNLILVTSEEILKELEDKLQHKFHWLEDDINLYLTKVKKASEIIEILEMVNIKLRDPDDIIILECALSGQADLIVTLDQDLIKLKKFKGIGIVHPKTFSWTFPKKISGIS